MKAIRQEPYAFIERGNFYMIFWVFVIGSLAGYFMEGLAFWARNGYWQHRAATVWGPFSTIYGLGAACIYWVCLRLEQRPPIWTFAACMLLGTLVEYLTAVFQQKCFGTVSWDYSDKFLNLNGRISLSMTLLWGVLGLAFMKMIFPPLCRGIMRIRGRSALIATWALIVFLGVDLAVSAAALTRWNERRQGKPATGAIARTIDQRYGDERMKKLYPNMEFVE